MPPRHEKVPPPPGLPALLGLTTIDDDGPADRVVAERLASGEYPRPACTEADLFEAIRILVPKVPTAREAIRKLCGLPTGHSFPENNAQKTIDDRVRRVARWLGVEFNKPKPGQSWVAIAERNYGKGGAKHWRDNNHTMVLAKNQPGRSMK